MPSMTPPRSNTQQEIPQVDIEKEIEKLIGKPKSHWIDQQWIPAEGSRLYTPDELRQVFSQECTLFVGDSLQRRAADTLNLMLSNSNESHITDIKNTAFPGEYFLQKKHDRGFAKRTIRPPADGSNSTSTAEGAKRLGCVDTDWRPLLVDVRDFCTNYTNGYSEETDYSQYTTIVVGATVWDVVGNSRRRTSAEEIRTLINETIYDLSETLPPSVTIIWKSSGWCYDCSWTPDEKRLNRADNYKIYAANDQAKLSIQEINATNLIYLDWAREVLPRSIGINRLRSWDRNPYHYALGPRVQFLQMLADVYTRRKESHSEMGGTEIKKGGLALGCPPTELSVQEMLQLRVQTRQLQSSTLLLLVGILLIVPFLGTNRRRERKR